MTFPLRAVAFGPQLFMLLVTALWFAMQIVALPDSDLGGGVRPR